jgi:predicted nuclease of predicted toxin-antitoxin system
LRFLIDECLSPSLCRVAHRRGFAADAVARIGKAGWADRELIRLVEAQDLALVTNNSRDFRRLYAELPVHAGLVCLNAPTNLVRRALIEALFDRALDVIGDRTDLPNTVIEVDAITVTRIEVRTYLLPLP